MISPPMRASIQQATVTSGGNKLALACLTSSSWQTVESRTLEPCPTFLSMETKRASRRFCSSRVSDSPGRPSKNSRILASFSSFACSRSACLSASVWSSSSAGRPRPHPFGSLRGGGALGGCGRSWGCSMPFAKAAAAALPTGVSTATWPAPWPGSKATSAARRRSSQPIIGAPLGSTAERACWSSRAFVPRVSCETRHLPFSFLMASRTCSRRTDSAFVKPFSGSEA
mmetsp:Transcript_128497/g.363672  ORF Transcript_128497/g.363672 Transcript_128497/m.363672 type:complete len:228 (+) Transcript_128497:802-1485(+)